MSYQIDFSSAVKSFTQTRPTQTLIPKMMTIIVKCLHGAPRRGKNLKTLSVDVDENATVRDLKLEIQNTKSIPIVQQKLVFNGQEIFQGTLASHNVQDESTVHLLIEKKRPPGTIKVLVITSDGKSYRLTANVSHKLSDLKHAIKTMTGIPIPLQRLLLSNGDFADDELTFSDYNLTSDCEIVVDTFLSKVDWKQIRVMNYTLGTRFTVRVKAQTTVRDLKMMIYEVDGTPEYEQLLEFGNKILRDPHSLSDYNIAELDEISVSKQITSTSPPKRRTLIDKFCSKVKTPYLKMTDEDRDSVTLRSEKLREWQEKCGTRCWKRILEFTDDTSNVLTPSQRKVLIDFSNRIHQKKTLFWIS